MLQLFFYSPTCYEEQKRASRCHCLISESLYSMYIPTVYIDTNCLNRIIINANNLLIVIIYL